MSSETVLTLLSQNSTLNRLAKALRNEEEGATRSTSLTINGAERRYGTEGIRRTIWDVRAERIHELSIESLGANRENFAVNYWANRV